MASKKSYGKVSKRASLNFGSEASTTSEKTKKKQTKKIKSSINKISTAAKIVMVVLIVVGIAGGIFATKFITRNDCFVLNGLDEQTLFISEETGPQTYKDEGANVVAFGQDDSDKIEIETNMKMNELGEYYADEVGTYYMIYKVKNFKYGSIFKIQKIRLITFVEESEGVEDVA